MRKSHTCKPQTYPLGMSIVSGLLKAIHPKTAAAGIAGAAVTLIVSAFAAYGHPLGADSTAALTAVAAFLAGWLKPAPTRLVQSGDAQDDGKDAA